MAATSTPKTDLASNPVPPLLEDSIKTIFSWVILMPIAVIVSGKLLSQRFKLASGSTQIFRISIIGLFEIRADDDEVILGFSGFFVTLFLVAIIAGKLIYERFKLQFGLDPGQFNCLCIFSSFATVVWSFALYLLAGATKGPMGPVRNEHAELIEKITTEAK